MLMEMDQQNPTMFFAKTACVDIVFVNKLDFWLKRQRGVVKMNKECRKANILYLLLSFERNN